jgi:hypothetical protein
MKSALQKFRIGTHRVEICGIAAIADELSVGYFGLEIVSTAALGPAFAARQLHLPI